MSTSQPAHLVPYNFKKGNGSPNPGGLTPERRALYKAIEAQELPRVLDLLTALYDMAIAGDVAAARLWLDQVRGPVKAREQDEIERAVEQRILELISEAKRIRDGQAREPSDTP